MGEGTHKIGLCLCGGGITGAMYEVGCLAALEEAFDGFQGPQFDVFVGASSGATVATALAGGLSAGRLYRALLDPADDYFPLQRNQLLRLDAHEWRRVGGSALAAARRLLTSATTKPLELDVWNELDRFYDSLPAGLFTMDAYERFFGQFMTRRGLPHEFRAMPRKLLIVANDLDRGERVVFGDPGTEDVPVERAVAASAALPILFAPVRIGDRDCIDGGIGEIAHVDLAVREGCDLIVVVNAMVPVKADPAAREVPTGHGPMKRVRDKGMLWVYQQAARIGAEARFQAGLRQFRDLHRGTRIELLEPDPARSTVFMYSPMNFTARRVILEEAYTSTIRTLKEESSPIRQVLVARGFAPRV